jgi:hypothetical protein
MSFAFSITNELTKKQEQTLRTVEKICFAFHHRDKKLPRKWENVKRVPRTWGDIKRLTGLSAGVLSKHLRTLISQDVVEVEKKLDEEGHLSTFYTYTGKSFTIEGKIGQTEIQRLPTKTREGTRIGTAYTFVPKKGSKQPSVLEAGRVYFDEEGVRRVEWGFSKRLRKEKVGKAREKRYFLKNKRLPAS